jgi:hypothetical protein
MRGTTREARCGMVAPVAQKTRNWMRSVNQAGERPKARSTASFPQPLFPTSPSLPAAWVRNRNSCDVHPRADLSQRANNAINSLCELASLPRDINKFAEF